MLRRFLLELSSSSSRLRRPLSYKTHLIHRNAFSSASKDSPAKLSKPPPAEPSSGGTAVKLLLGGVAVGAAFMAAKEAGYFDIGLPGSGREDMPKKDSSLRNLNYVESTEDIADHKEKETTQSGYVAVGEEPPASVEGPSQELTKMPEELPVDIQNELTGVKDGGVSREVGELVADSDRRWEESVDTESSTRLTEPLSHTESSTQLESEVELRSYVETPVHEETVEEEAATEQVAAHEEPKELGAPLESKVEAKSYVETPVHEETVEEEATTEQVAAHEDSKDSTGFENESPESLAKTYLLQEGDAEFPSKEEISTISTPILEEEDSVIEVSKYRDEQADEKIVLDLIQAIHTAEKRQAESDFRVFEEEKRLLKDKYEKELRDARARELMYAEEAALMEKELNKEKTKAAAALKTLQDKSDQKLRSELQQKEEEAEMQLKKARELAKAELNAAVASEKSSQMEKIAEANLHINALCMAFYARSEEARQNHSVHKLALGALALEEALSKGLPIRGEIEALLESLVDVRSDSLIDLVLSSLPAETLSYGTDTKLQLNQKFDDLKRTVRHFCLIPPGSGGILTHAVAYIASFIKVRETDTSGAGIESVISRVEKLLAEGKLSEAAYALEQGVTGTEAEGAIGEWVKQTKNRAIVEQAVTLIRSYTTIISLS